MRRTRYFLSFFVIVATLHGASLTPRSGWVFVSGGQDLIAAGQWNCVSGVTLGTGTLTVAATTNYNTVLDTAGPILSVTGDFSVMAQISATDSTGTFLSLVGQMATGAQFWQGLKRLDVGVDNKGILAYYWTGDSANNTSHSYALPAGATDTITLEVARIGSSITIFVNGSQVGTFADPGLFASGTVYIGFNAAPNNTMTVDALAAAMPAGGQSAISAPYRQVARRSGTALRDIAGSSAMLVGAALNPSYFGDPNYIQAAGREFNLAVPENALKFAETEPAAHQFSFCSSDQVVKFAQANGMKIRGHNLVWNLDLPSWLTSGNFTPAQASSILQEHITTVMGHYKGQLLDWDVVNEVTSDSPPYGLKDSYWLTQLGNNYVDMAFQWAHAADPSAKLFYNEYSNEGLGAKSDAVYNFVKGMLSRKIPINGVGMQMHVDLNSAPSQADLTSNIARLGALGLEVQITEMDVRVPVDANGNASAADLAAQATIYQNVFAACQASPNCTAVLTWGVTDLHSWIPSTFPGTGAALLLDQNYKVKPAYNSVAGVLRSNNHTTVPTIAAVTNGASFAAGSLAPGAIATLFGSNLTSASGINLTSTLPLPTDFLDSGVSVNGFLAPIFAVDSVNGQQQINFQVPWEVAGNATATVAAVHSGIASQSVTLPVVAAQPGIISYNSGGNNFGVILHADFQLADSAHPATAGETVLIYCTGLGVVSAGPADGAPASGQETVVQPTATIGGVSSHVAFSGLAPAFVGLNQVNVVVPSGLHGNQPVVLDLNGAKNPPVLLPIQ